MCNTEAKQYKKTMIAQISNHGSPVISKEAYPIEKHKNPAFLDISRVGHHEITDL
ncbi:hypothetical protein [Bacillus sp. FJAT-22090]|uniref:hypothetical protein n=1 Tax=Bacillus sp. FJAT-22090 TaxID=1581038 RepID=UPI001643579B|nr:hypothetical protein [Bacillus sp. FJAT-22090]